MLPIIYILMYNITMELLCFSLCSIIFYNNALCLSSHHPTLCNNRLIWTHYLTPITPWWRWTTTKDIFLKGFFFYSKKQHFTKKTSSYTKRVQIVWDKYIISATFYRWFCCVSIFLPVVMSVKILSRVLRLQINVFILLTDTVITLNLALNVKMCFSCCC